MAGKKKFEDSIAKTFTLPQKLYEKMVQMAAERTLHQSKNIYWTDVAVDLMQAGCKETKETKETNDGTSMFCL